MTITYVNGDLILAAKNGEVDVIAHCCNCFNTMGAGIAKQIAKNFPEAEEVDSKTIRGDGSKLGTFSKTHNIGGLPGNITPTVFNLYGQYYYGSFGSVDYEALESSLSLMAKNVILANNVRKYMGMVPESIGIPRLGCGLAKGDWQTVEAIINKVCDRLDMRVYTLT